MSKDVEITETCLAELNTLIFTLELNILCQVTFNEITEQIV
jgi:hypothetical protein